MNLNMSIYKRLNPKLLVQARMGLGLLHWANMSNISNMNPKYKLLMNFFVIILRDVNALNTNLEKQTSQNSMHV